MRPNASVPALQSAFERERENVITVCFSSKACISRSSTRSTIGTSTSTTIHTQSEVELLHTHEDTRVIYACEMRVDETRARRNVFSVNVQSLRCAESNEEQRVRAVFLRAQARAAEPNFTDDDVAARGNRRSANRRVVRTTNARINSNVVGRNQRVWRDCDSRRSAVSRKNKNKK